MASDGLSIHGIDADAWRTWLGSFGRMMALSTDELEGPLLPTPNAMDSLPPRSDAAVKARNRGNGDHGGSPRNLRETVANELMPLLPTPQARDWRGGNYAIGRSRDGRPRKPGDMALPDAIALLPTPNGRDWKGSPGQGSRARGGHQASLPAAVADMLGTDLQADDAPEHDDQDQLQLWDEDE